MNYNQVLLGARLTRDPELRYTPSNTAVCSFGVAVNRRWKNQQGEQQNEVTFLDCEAFGRQAEVMAEHLHKGDPVFISGRIKMDQWADKQTGEQKKKLVVVVNTFEFISTRGDQGTGASGQEDQRTGFDDSNESQVRQGEDDKPPF